MAMCFRTWLSEKLFNLNNDVDLEVFVSYITGILEADSAIDDKKDSLGDIIAEILPDDKIAEHCTEIVDKWNELSASEDHEQQAAASTRSSIDTTIHSIIEQQTAVVSTCKQTTVSDSSHKQAILAQYAQMSDSEESDTGVDEPGGKQSAAPSSSDLLVKNMNVLMVKERERSERDRAKQESELKRQKDKEDREKQRQKQQERKDTEKKRTQKSEKKR